MLIPIHSFISDLRLEQDLLRGIKVRRIEQKHRYTEKGAQKFYESYISNPNTESYFGSSLAWNDYLNFFKRYITYADKLQKLAFVLLGCGKVLERDLIKTLHDEGHNLHFIGVDSSHAMLELANENLKDYDFDKMLICADFTEDNFTTEINRVIGSFDKRLFAFLGGTFSVFIPTDIVDTLANIVTDNDMLWVEVLLREDMTERNNLMLFKHFAKRLERSTRIRNDAYPIEKMGIPFENGEMTLETIKEPAVGAINFKYVFLMKKKTRIHFRNEMITLLPDEKIELLNIRAYDSEKLVNFFEEHGFKFISSERKKNRGQFLFQLKEK